MRVPEWQGRQEPAAVRAAAGSGSAASGCGGEIPARGGTLAAGLRAAAHQIVAVLLALGRTSIAYLGAEFAPSRRQRRLPGHDAGARLADFGAFQTEPEAGLHLGVANAAARTLLAGCRAVEALTDTVLKLLLIHGVHSLVDKRGYCLVRDELSAARPSCARAARAVSDRIDVVSVPGTDSSSGGANSRPSMCGSIRRSRTTPPVCHTPTTCQPCPKPARSDCRRYPPGP